MPIIWREQMSVGNTLIDNEHRVLIDLINQVESALQITENHHILSAALVKLLDYTGYHFEHEEKIQKKVGYLEQNKHKQEHQRIMKDLRTIQLQLDRILNPAGVEETSIDKEVTDSELNQLLDDDSHNVDANDLAGLIKLIRHWVLDHVLVTDLKMKPFLSKYPPNLS